MEAKEGAEDEEEDDDEDDDAEDLRIGQSAREQPAVVCNRRMSPFDVRFSQVRARDQFRDGRLVEAAIGQIRAVPCDLGEGQSQGAEGTEQGTWLLEHPFPPIEVLQWRCKLRDEQTGRPRIDPKTGGELYDQHRWFSLDNRRLYCLQKTAASIWPRRAVIDVVELPADTLLCSGRQLKKFRTLDRGCSILIGCRGEVDGGGLLRWSWRDATGLQAEASEPDVENCHVQMRRRHRGHPSRQQQASPRPGYGGGEAKNARSTAPGAPGGINPMSPSGMLVFFLIYLVLRLFMNLLTTTFKNLN